MSNNNVNEVTMMNLLLLLSLLTLSVTCHGFQNSPQRRWPPLSSSSSSTLHSSTTTDDNITTKDVLSLSSIRSTLIRQEETIIFALIERAQFRRNEVVYQKGGVPGLGWPVGAVRSENEEEDEELSFLDFMLIGTVSYICGCCKTDSMLMIYVYINKLYFTQEVLHSAVRRYESIEEHAFFPSKLPKRTNSLSTLDYPDLLSQDADTNGLNWNPILYNKYLNLIVPAIAAKGDDEQYGSTVLADINVLQALSKRIHYGKFVAESKYRSDPDGFQKLVDAGDADGVMKLLTNEKVEEQVLTRARLKATTYGREPLLAAMPKVHSNAGDSATAIIASAAAMAVVAACEAVQNTAEETLKGKVDPGMIEAIYKQLIIPMTKDVEVAYLFMRCGREPPEEYSCDRMSLDVVELEPRKIS
ncbi:hypothetical protein ACHAWO_004889 [Cyclotella atomus]|uniref:chorismate mutase n=1 Tax=Cyclotella atomus TaxID=382360 RepID=A0ABD3P8U9_9STRA